MTDTNNAIFSYMKIVEEEKKRTLMPDGTNQGWQDKINAGYLSKDRLINAKTAFLDITMDVGNSNTDFANKVYDLLHTSGAIVDYSEERDDDFTDGVNNAINNGWPSIYERGLQRDGFKHLIFEIQKRSSEFGKMTAQEIADNLFNFAYTTNTGGGIPNIAVSRKDMARANITEDDIDKSMPYLLMAPSKKGYTRTFMPDDFGITQFGLTGKLKVGVGALEKMQEEIDKATGGLLEGASMWQAVVPASDGDGVSIVVMVGEKGNRAKSWMVGNMYQTSKTEVDKNGNLIQEEIQYNKEEMLEMFKTWRRGHYMDAENDSWEMHSLKERISDYVKDYNEKGITGNRRRIPDYLIELYDPGKFEYDNVILPFYKEYGPKGANLNDQEFAKKWDEVWEKTTFTMGDEIHAFFNADLYDGMESRPSDLRSILFGQSSKLVNPTGYRK